MLPGLVRVVNDGALKRLVWAAPRENTRELAERIRADYRQWSSRELAISENSLMAEIWGHMLVERYALRFRKLVNISITNKVLRFLLERMAVIDCGERRIDRNRFIWDRIAPCRNLLCRLLPRR